MNISCPTKQVHTHTHLQGLDMSLPPVVAETSVGADLLEPLQVLTQLVIQLVGQHLTEATVLHVLLSVQEPVGDLVLTGVRHHCDDALNLQ